MSEPSPRVVRAIEHLGDVVLDLLRGAAVLAVASALIIAILYPRADPGSTVRSVHGAGTQARAAHDCRRACDPLQFRIIDGACMCRTSSQTWSAP